MILERTLAVQAAVRPGTPNTHSARLNLHLPALMNRMPAPPTCELPQYNNRVPATAACCTRLPPACNKARARNVPLLVEPAGGQPAWLCASSVSAAPPPAAPPQRTTFKHPPHLAYIHNQPSPASLWQHIKPPASHAGPDQIRSTAEACDSHHSPANRLQCTWKMSQQRRQPR